MNKVSTTTETILACASKLILAGGYNGFSYADVASVVGISKATIHHHFPTKADLVKALLAGYYREAERGFKHLECAVPAPCEQLRAYVRYWDACIGDASIPFCVCALLASELPALPEAVAHEVRAYFRCLSAWLTSLLDLGIRKGELSLHYPAGVEAEVLMATVHGAMLSARAYGEGSVFASIVNPQLERMLAKS